ncbi:hypothetical protein Sthe_3256 [Sphaerobacter thermophilus DSM 20745]|uniref:Uncharacterized protein n=1 Tax=Sphaerobacter thermophilus (strain ATCC 49802 / DSM 20745 / KCCM 41009 / NCIMB 13125 / S 6022) TaxID=479434 RepID=D1CA13_SPHTD|nr:hypothetical protein Sthe_3256 [Sphaerobacter thermophilus DSM 20745]
MYAVGACPGLKPRADNESRLKPAGDGAVGMSGYFVKDHKPAVKCGGLSRRFGIARRQPRAGWVPRRGRDTGWVV